MGTIPFRPSLYANIHGFASGDVMFPAGRHWHWLKAEEGRRGSTEWAAEIGERGNNLAQPAWQHGKFSVGRSFPAEKCMFLLSCFPRLRDCVVAPDEKKPNAKCSKK